MTEPAIVTLILAVLVVVGALVLRRGFPAHPCPGARVSSPFGARIDPITGQTAGHKGVDFAVTVGTELHALADGIVTDTALNAGADGVFVRVDTQDGRDFSFSHCSALLVREGEAVRAGQVIARSGNSGRSTGPHLHLGVRVAGVAVDPLPLLPA